MGRRWAPQLAPAPAPVPLPHLRRLRRRRRDRRRPCSDRWRHRRQCRHRRGGRNSFLSVPSILHRVQAQSSGVVYSMPWWRRTESGVSSFLPSLRPSENDHAMVFQGCAAQCMTSSPCPLHRLRRRLRAARRVREMRPRPERRRDLGGGAEHGRSDVERGGASARSHSPEIFRERARSGDGHGRVSASAAAALAGRWAECRRWLAGGHRRTGTAGPDGRATGACGAEHHRFGGSRPRGKKRSAPSLLAPPPPLSPLLWRVVVGVPSGRCSFAGPRSRRSRGRSGKR